MEYRQGAVTLHYEQDTAGLRITGMDGDLLSISLPQEIAGNAVTTIGKKAFLACSRLQEIRLPDSVRILEDWAFASCKSLRTVSLKKENIMFGKGVFRGCDLLTEIRLRSLDYDDSQPGLGFLFAAGDKLLDSLYLLDAENAGTQSWYEKWDARMRVLMNQADEEGFSKMLLCGEEDYGSRENTLEHYVSENRRRKAKIAFLRLLYPYYLEESNERLLTDFLKAHTKGRESGEAWELLRDEHGDDAAYYKLFTAIGAVTQDNCQAMIADLGERHTEMKAFLLKQSSMDVQEDFFDSLAL